VGTSLVDKTLAVIGFGKVGQSGGWLAPRRQAPRHRGGRHRD
jgi:hypothetical protein